ncbi:MULTISPECIES: STAS domain-containing protein [Ezakiella]|uniref:STAS domain-containing protein n=1 Tax=Ezakiella TaxID=1582879 RepID=UPI00094F2063|nr:MULTISPECIES: STAS domain-containing protein [Ezakiella]
MNIFKKDGTIYIDGELDIFNAQDVRVRVLDEYEKSKSDIVLDFSHVSFMDSTGLGVLISIQKVLNDDGYKLRIVNVDPKIKKIFVITELEEVFDIK